MTYILGGARTPQGSLLGSLATFSAPKLGSVAIAGAIKKSNIKNEQVEEVFMGNVLSSGVGQAPARQASILAGLSDSVPCTTINKVCGSGLKSFILAAQQIQLGEASITIGGGMENMSMAPGLLMNYRTGNKFGHSEIKDSMLHDGLWDVYSQRSMGLCAEECATKYDLTRQMQDEFSELSFKRAQAAQKDGVYQWEIAPVITEVKGKTTTIDTDEGPGKVQFDKIPTLKPAFSTNGTITAANASTINDGACALVLAGDQFKGQAEFKIVSYASHAHGPTWFTTAPIMSMEKALNKAKLKISEIDLFEINEAFSLVPLVCMKELKISHDKVNIFGGGVSLGHPIGASGARIVLTMKNALNRKQKRLGMCSICIGGGEALALIIEKIK